MVRFSKSIESWARTHFYVSSAIHSMMSETIRPKELEEAILAQDIKPESIVMLAEKITNEFESHYALEYIYPQNLESKVHEWIRNNVN